MNPRIYGLIGFVLWMLAWPLADKYERYGTLIVLCGTAALSVGLILAVR